MSKTVRIATVVTVAFFMALLIVFPAVYMQAVSDGLRLFCVSVLPAMFPFFFFSRLLTSLDVAASLSRLVRKPVRYLFGAPEIGGYIFAMSVMCGYPVGAKLVSDSVQLGLCTEEEAKSLVAFTSTSGPLFVLGTVGSGMFGDTRAGVVILVAHYLATILNGIVFKRRQSSKTPEASLPRPGGSYDDVLADAVSSSVRSILLIGAYITLFNMIATAFVHIGAVDAVGRLLAPLGISEGLCGGVLLGLIEVTRGTLLLAGTPDLLLSVPLAAALVSFGGASIAFQSLAFLSKCKITAGYFFCTKISHAVITFLIAFALSALVF